MAEVKPVTEAEILAGVLEATGLLMHPNSGILDIESTRSHWVANGYLQKRGFLKNEWWSQSCF